MLKIIYAIIKWFIMKYKIPLAGTAQLIKITADYYKSWKVWKVEFTDGKIAVLFKFGDEWMQRHEDFLDASALRTIGQCIDEIIFKKSNIAL
jgi:hypothetical protein